jgi:large conductance mechanosensitive channel
MFDSFHSSERQFVGRLGEKEWRDYKRFAFRDDMMKLTVGVVMGSAFNKVIQSMSNNLVMPLLSFLTLSTGEAWRDWSFTPTSGLSLPIGRVAGDGLDFLVVSVSLYLIYVKLVGRLYRDGIDKPLPTKQCPLCLERVNAAALKCKFCGGNLDGPERGSGTEDQGAKDGGGEQQGPDGPSRKDRNSSAGPRKPNNRTDGRRVVPRHRRKR